MGYAKDIEKLLYSAGVEMPAKNFVTLTYVYAVGFGLAAALFFLRASLSLSALAFFAVFSIILFSIYVFLLLTASKRIAMAEDMLPDLLTLMASNIRSGLTPDTALIVSARREFGPLTREINKATKFVIAGRSFDEAFEIVGANIASNTISKAVRLIVEGSRAGGNLAELLDNTAADIRRFNALKNEVSSNVNIYRFFLFTASALGAPFLFASANFMISLVARVKGVVGVLGSPVEAGNMAFSVMEKLATSSALSPELIFYFSLGSLFMSVLFAALAGGIISSGRASDDLKYFPILLAIAMTTFLGTKFVLEQVFTNLFFT